MAFLFKSKHKSPSELVKSTKENLQKLDAPGDNKKVQSFFNTSILRHLDFFFFLSHFLFSFLLFSAQYQEELSRNLAAIKQVLYGDSEGLSSSFVPVVPFWLLLAFFFFFSSFLVTFLKSQFF